MKLTLNQFLIHSLVIKKYIKNLEILEKNNAKLYKSSKEKKYHLSLFLFCWSASGTSRNTQCHAEREPTKESFLSRLIYTWRLPCMWRTWKVSRNSANKFIEEVVLSRSLARERFIKIPGATYNKREEEAQERVSRNRREACRCATQNLRMWEWIKIDDGLSYRIVNV